MRAALLFSMDELHHEDVDPSICKLAVALQPLSFSRRRCPSSSTTSSQSSSRPSSSQRGLTTCATHCGLARFANRPATKPRPYLRLALALAFAVSLAPCHLYPVIYALTKQALSSRIARTTAWSGPTASTTACAATQSVHSSARAQSTTQCHR